MSHPLQLVACPYCQTSHASLTQGSTVAAYNAWIAEQERL